jgi:hypothetical protein
MILQPLDEEKHKEQQVTVKLLGCRVSRFNGKSGGRLGRRSISEACFRFALILAARNRHCEAM